MKVKLNKSTKNLKIKASCWKARGLFRILKLGVQSLSFFISNINV